MELRQERLSQSGEDMTQDASISMSRFVYVGCFQRSMTITSSALYGIYRDPNECIAECKALSIYEKTVVSQLVVAVLNDPTQGRCGCALKRDFADFQEDTSSPSACTYRCKNYLNPNCGGYPDFWGVYMEYESQSMSTQGAFDPWRYVWYTVVTIREMTIQGTYPLDNVLPERYYLHAADIVSGVSRFEYQMRIVGGILYGLQYDLDGSRLVALYTYSQTGRLRSDLDWQYKLATIFINASNPYRVYMQMSTSQLAITTERTAVPQPRLVSLEYMAYYSGASAIYSKFNNYVFAQAEWSGLKNQMKDRIYIVRFPDGYIVREQPIDFKVANLYTNEKFGDLSCTGPRLEPSVRGGRMTYVYLGRVYRSAVDSTTLVDWAYNSVNPQRLMDPSIIGDYQIYPGVSANEHLLNQSAVAWRYKTPEHPWGAMTITVVDIRPPYRQQVWCNANACQGTLDYDIPYAGIFNREPGIPLSQKAPAFLSPARFNMDASAITVKFDRSTLQGARQVSDTGDVVPDRIDDTYQRLNGPFDCSEMWSADTIQKLGPWPSTQCLWVSNSQLRISLGIINLAVGDVLFILPDVLYAIPTADGEWSPATTGGVVIGLPSPLEYPVIIPSGSVEIDICSPVRLRVDSLLDGSLATWNWSWVPSTDASPNPEDLAARPLYVFDPVKIRTIQTYLAQATQRNNKTLLIPSTLFEPAGAYKVRVSVTSRWNLTSNFTFTLEKTSFAKPTVYIDGPPLVTSYRWQITNLVGICMPSACADPDTVLAYRWAATGQAEAPSGVPLNFADYPDIVSTASTLVIPAYTLEPVADSTYNVYNFTIECYVDTELGDTPERTAQATVMVQVPQSSIVVKMTVGDRQLTISDILVLDSTQSQDPDFPPASEGLTFQGTFQYRCLTPPPARAPCWVYTRRLDDGREIESEWLPMPAEPRMLQATSGFIPRSNILSCRQDIGTLLNDGGETYFMPLFDNLDYCQYARGVLMVQTVDFIVGEYKWTIKATHNDGRTGSLDIYITMVLERVPRLILTFVNPPVNNKFSTTQEIRIRGTMDGTPSNSTTIRYSWQIFSYELNPAYNADLAARAANDPNNPYTVDQYIYIDKTSTFGGSTLNPAFFDASPSSPNLVIKAGTLQPSSTYKVRLNIHVGSVTGFSEIGILTAGGPPRNGQFICTPIYGAFTTPRSLNAPSWNADDSPLTYEFGYYSFQSGVVVPVLQAFSAAPSQVRTLDITSMPLGTRNGDVGNYTIPLYVRVCTPFQACTTATTIVNSDLPSNPSAAIDDLLNQGASGDATTALNSYTSALSAAGANQTVISSILDGLASREMSADARSVGAVAALLATMVAQCAGGNSDIAERVLNALEQTTQVAANNNLFNQNSAIAASTFNALGGLMPGANLVNPNCPGLRRLGARSSTALGRLRTPDSVQGLESSGRRLDVTNSLQTTRQRSNHLMPRNTWTAITECETAFCDRPGLWCLPTGGTNRAYRCCDARNPKTICDDPPCWFEGSSCPSASIDAAGGAATDGRRLQNERGDRKGRRTPVASPPRRVPGQAALATQGAGRASQPQRGGESWFDSWVEYNFPAGALDENDVSEYNRIRGYHGWHPDIYQRRLEFMSINDTISAAFRLQRLEEVEVPLVQQAQQAVAAASIAGENDIQAESDQEITYSEQPAVLANRLKAQDAQAEQVATDRQQQWERNNSQRITRVNVLRDTIAKSLIVQMLPNQNQVFTSVTFKITIGKTPDLTSIHPHFQFPAPFFKRPADSPDSPTALRPLTGFSYVFVEYTANIYYWSPSSPPSNEFALVTMIALNANTTDLGMTSVDTPIRLFKQYDIFSNAICVYWDRFAANTAGGQFSMQGVMNDGDACITSHLSDIGVFLDGRVPAGYSLVDAATSWEREVWENNCVGCNSGYNLFPVAVLGMILFVVMLLILLGYVQDERRRSDMKKNKAKSRYYYDGDGLTSALNVDDPIAYSLRDVNMMGFWTGTFTNVLFREHAIIGVIFYHETFTRPQRLYCFTSLLCGLMAINAAVHSHPGQIQGTREYVIVGVLSGLLVFPVFCGLVLMFNLRPAQVKKRLIKKTYSTREIDLINDQRQKLANQTSLLPPRGYMAKPPSLMALAAPGQQTLLSLPAPLPLPPMLPGQVGRPSQLGMFALPPPPAYGGMTGMLALPALPGMSASMPLPPPPKYPPPPKSAKVPSPAALMPPLNWPKVGPPPTPFPALQAPDASIGGSYTNLPMLNSRLPLPAPDTGATPLQLTDHFGSAGVTGGPSMDAEASWPPRAHFKEDMRHGALPNLPGSTDEALPEPQNPPGSFTPPGGMTPTTSSASQMPRRPPPPGAGAGVGPLDTPTSSQQASSRFGPLPLPPPRPGSAALLLHNAVPPPLFIRGGPPSMLPSPFPPLPTGPNGMSSFALAGIPPPGFRPPVPMSGGPPGPPGFPPAGAGAPPAPPPPPREDEQAFVRRIKLTYMDKVTREHDKLDLLEDHEELGKDVPFWVFDTMTMMPYLASCTFTLACIFVVLQYGVKFQPWQQDYWLKGSLVGLAMTLVLLELFRIAMMTLVELRKFENRRKAKAGHFLQRRVKKEGDDNFQAAPPPRLWKRAVAAPVVPKAKEAPMRLPTRPQFLPMADMPALPSRPPPKALVAGVGPPALAGAGRIPVAPARPPVFSAAAMSRAGALDDPPLPGTPQSSHFGGGPGRPGFMTPPLGGTMTPGGIGSFSPSTAARPAAATMRAADFASTLGGPQTPGRPVSPTHSSHSLSSLAQSLNQQVKAGRHAEAPPPPPAQPGAMPAQGSAPPPAPAAPPPSYSRPPSRPTSAGGVQKPATGPPRR